MFDDLPNNQIAIKIQEMLDDVDDDNIEELKKTIHEQASDLTNQNNDRYFWKSLLSLIETSTFARPKKLRFYTQILTDIIPHIRRLLTGEEMIEIIKNNTLRLVLLKNECIKLNDFIDLDTISTADFKFFSKEMLDNHFYHENQEPDLAKIVSELDKDYDQLRQSGMNTNNVAQMIQNDDIVQFQDFISHTNTNVNSTVPRSIYETNRFLLQERFAPTYIEYAAFCGSMKIFKYLLLNKARIQFIGPRYAISGGNLDIIHILEDIKVANFDEGCLIHAIVFHQNEILDYLHSSLGIQYGKNCLKWSILSYNYYAFSKILASFVKKSKKSKKSNDIEGFEHLFAVGLQAAVKSGSLEMVEYIVSSTKIDFNKMNEKKEYGLIHKAAQYANIDVFRFISSLPALDPHTKGVYDQTCLHYAAISGKADIVKYLINEKQFDVNETNMFGDTPLHLASKYGKIDVIKVLIANPKCNIWLRNINKETALGIAVLNNHTETAKELLSIPCSCDKEIESDLQIALQLACRQGNDQIVELIANHKCINLNEKGPLGYSALHWAAQTGNLNLIKFLTSCKGIDINIRDKRQNTPLHKACEYGKYDCAKYLLSLKDIDVTSKNAVGMTCIALSQKSHSKDIERLILDYMHTNNH